MLQTLLSHLQAYRAQGRNAFVRSMNVPVLVLDPFLPLDDTGFQTVRGDAIRDGSPTVGRIEKREGTNPFAQMITIGRARNNDLEVKSASVSKFHAYFTINGSGAVFVTDGGSTFGTKVNGSSLLPKVPSPVESGTTIELGNLKTVLYTPEAFATFLDEQLHSR